MILSQPIIGKLVNIRSADVADAEYTYRIRQDEGKTKYLSPVNGTVEDQARFIEEQRQRNDSYFFIVEDKEGNALGTTALYDYDPLKNTVTHGRILLYGSPIQDTEAIVLVYDYAFYGLGVDVAIGNPLEENLPSIGVTKRVGGRLVDREYDPRFQQDILYFHIDKEVYEAKRIGIYKLVDRFAR